MKTKQQKAKENLISHHRLKQCDFYEENGVIYTIIKDSYIEKVIDVWEEILLTQKEENKAQAYERV